MEGLKIWLVTVAGTMAYGIAHDQVTARVSLEYFTVGHPRIFATESATLIAFGWGVLATWWVGALLGFALALAARFGGRPKLAVRDLLPAGAALFLSVGAVALVAGLVGYVVAREGLMSLSGTLASEVPEGGHARFIANYWAHTAAYVAGLAGGLALAAWVWIRRTRLAGLPPAARSSPTPRARRGPSTQRSPARR